MKGEQKTNIVLRGIPASPGIAIAEGFYLERSLPSFVKSYVPDYMVEDEVEKFLKAVEKSKSQLREIRDSLPDRESEHARILDVHLGLLEDSMLIDSTVKLIRDYRFKAEWALNRVLTGIINSFHRIEDAYLKERGDDIKQIAHRIFENLAGRKVDSISDITEEVVVVAHDLSPADTAQMLSRPVRGFATDVGSRTSHTAIVARSIGIPAVVGLGNVTEHFYPGARVIVDGYEGTVIISPDASVEEEYRKKLVRSEKRRKSLVKFSKLPAVTRDGHRMMVMANIELPEEADQALQLGADGIGLYRTEFIFLNRRSLPDEEEQFEIYRRVVEKFHDSPVVIRTIDLGGDKFASHIDLAEEMNPAMGLRAIRFCLREKEIFRTQLRAILRASKFGDVRVLIPMISGVQEVRETRKIFEEVKGELKRDGLPFSERVELGIMIEVPSAALISDILARMVDFFSIGTNDLIQYAIAIDRVNEYVTYLYEPLHPALLRMIRTIIDAAKKAGIPVGMCGEMAGEPLYIPVLLGLGLDELSMNASSIPVVKSLIRKSSRAELENFVEELFSYETGDEVLRRVKSLFEELYPEEMNDK
ncbi:MAG: phosphoenolpyruvate--protein phosphotransferase [Deltaproteobacteria bacterium]|nr:MAG: phosphoenolpyruvate--protein phosphotransferase [Deltaproteobacteria bacterium]